MAMVAVYGKAMSAVNVNAFVPRCLKSPGSPWASANIGITSLPTMTLIVVTGSMAKLYAKP